MTDDLRYAELPMGCRTPVEKMTDVQLIDACRDGLEPAWGEFVNRFGRLVYAAARRRGLRHADAEEVLQRTFESAWKHIDQLRDSKAVRGWLLTTAHAAILACWSCGDKDAILYRCNRRTQRR